MEAENWRRCLKICLIEACQDSDVGSIGAFYIKTDIEKARYSVDVSRTTKAGYDIELISIHHCLDFMRLVKLPKRAKIRLVGGHPMQNNPRPVIAFADAVFVGEGEGVIGRSIKEIEKKGIDGLREIEGWLISSDWEKGNDIPKPRICNPLPDNPPYLNRPGTLSRAWYIEIARGCPFKCAYCELGHSSKFRLYGKERIKKAIDLCDVKQARKINFYAPDEASHPDYKELYEYLEMKGLNSAFSSMRLESVMKNNPPIKKNQLIRIGIDGLTEATRFKVNKKITNGMIVAYFKKLIDQGHINFKLFMIIGYPWERSADFKEFELLMDSVLHLQTKKNIMLRIKWTPFIPQPCTPLGNTIAQYDWDLIEKIHIWHGLNKQPRHEPGFWITNDGLMTEKSHRLQIELTAGDEDVLKKMGA